MPAPSRCGGGLISVTVSGIGAVLDVRLDPDVKRYDPAELEQMILDALRGAQKSAKEHAEQTVAAFAQRQVPR
jgi:DNA-binding protein YbaB